MDERQQLEQAIEALEAQRATLGDAVVDASVSTLQLRLASLSASNPIQQRKQVTALVADISGFTALSESMDAEDVGTLINELWTKLDKIILDNHGWIEKHIGDAVIAYWGIKVASENDSALAVESGLSMQAAITEINSESLVKLGMRIGIHTGSVLIGEIGSMGEMTAIGNTINIATQLEQACPKDFVLVSQQVYPHVRGRFELEKFSVPDVQESAYLVRGRLSRDFRNPTRGIEGIETHMIGRDHEIRLLQDAFRDVVSKNQMRAVTISAEAGLGKSRLLFEFENWVKRTPTSVKILKSRAEEQSIRVPFGLARNLWAGYFNIQESDDGLKAREKWQVGISNLLIKDAEAAAHLLGQALGFDFSESKHVQALLNDPPLIQRRAFYYASEIMKALAQTSPTLIILDDIHWADERSLELMLHLLAECANLQVLFVFSARPSFYDRQTEWHQPTHEHVRLDLSPLSREDSRLLVYEILKKVRDLPTQFQDLLFTNAEGNPFYLEEIIKMMIEQEAIVKNEQEWWINPEKLKTMQVPSTLTGVLQARLDRLSSPEKIILQKAAIIGRIFWDSAVTFVGNSVLKEDQEILAKLQNKEIIFSRTETSFDGATEYMFKHSILRNVTYDQVLKGDRKKYHRRAAEWLISRAGERADTLAAIIAEHFERAEQIDSALQWYIRAAQYSQSSYALDLSIRYYRIALDLKSANKSIATTFDLLTGLGQSLMVSGDYDSALDIFIQAKELAADMRDTTRLAKAYLQLYDIYSRLDNFSATFEVAKKARELAEKMEPTDPAIISQAIWSMGAARYRNSDIEQAMDLFLESLAISEISNARPQIANNYNMIGVLYLQFGKYKEAIDMMQNSLLIWQELGHREFQSNLYSNLGEVYRICGEYEKGMEHLNHAFAIVSSYGAKVEELTLLNNMGLCYFGLQQYDEALKCLDKVLNSHYLPLFKFEAELYTCLALISATTGQTRDAQTSARLALRYATEGGKAAEIAMAWVAMGRAAASAKDGVAFIGAGAGSLSITSDECFKRGLAHLADIHRYEYAVIHWHWALANQKLNNKTQAEKYFQIAANKFTELGLQKLTQQVLSDSVNEIAIA